MSRTELGYNEPIFIEQLQVACAREKTPKTPYQPIEKCGFLHGLFDAIKIVWRTLWGPKETSIAHVARSMLRNREVSPSAIRWFCDRTIEKIFSGVSPNDRVLEEAAKHAIVDARATHTRHTIASIFYKTFPRDAALIARIPTKGEDQHINELIQECQIACAERNSHTMEKTLKELRKLTQRRDFSPQQKLDFEYLKRNTPPVVVAELGHKDGIQHDIGKIILGLMEIDPTMQREIEADLRLANGHIDALLQAKFVSLGDRFGHALSTLDLHGINMVERIGGVYNQRKVMAIIHAFPNLTKLNLVNCELTGNSISAIGERLKQLEELDMSCNYNIRFHSLDRTKNPFANLHTLTMNDSGFRDEDLEAMPVLAKLDSLHIRGGEGPMHDTQFQKPLPLIAARCPNLTHLDLGGSYHLAIQQLEGLDQLQRLERLTLTHCPQISAAEIADLRAKFPHLEIVS